MEWKRQPRRRLEGKGVSVGISFHLSKTDVMGRGKNRVLWTRVRISAADPSPVDALEGSNTPLQKKLLPHLTMITTCPTNPT